MPSKNRTPEQARAYNQAYRDRQKAKRQAQAGPKATFNSETYTVSIRCPYCSWPTKAVNQRVSRSELVARLECCNVHCGHELITRTQVGAVLLDPEHEPTKCGTSAGYTQHRRKGEPACPACNEARNRRIIDSQTTRLRREA